MARNNMMLLPILTKQRLQEQEHPVSNSITANETPPKAQQAFQPQVPPHHRHLRLKATPLPPSITASTSAEDPALDRGGWVQRLTNYVYEDRHERRYNVLTINEELEYHLNCSGQDPVEEHRLTYQKPGNAGTVPYRVVVFERGQLLNLGDGGWINLDLKGNWSVLGEGAWNFKPCCEE
ncbi:hypothetical protein NKR23_g4153 [Pleurostoma richardsiae]|uniref:Uncharacterized protein n=1 Tax=Pleurostoma richardsiae TaxID=41990 RepID=A0AA38RHI2_9PEZI|nr:hypothetical protein NKR23_g4153 [Pleurostoma richardsiae]